MIWAAVNCARAKAVAPASGAACRVIDARAQVAAQHDYHPGTTLGYGSEEVIMHSYASEIVSAHLQRGIVHRYVNGRDRSIEYNSQPVISGEHMISCYVA